MLIKKLQRRLKELPYFKRVVVGVSGGADSIALAHALHTLGYELYIVHINHCLRGNESDGDESFVQEFAKELKVPIFSIKFPTSTEGNLENNARKVRYYFFEKVRQSFKAEYTTVAHQEDDQIETILMHKERGAGLRGLRGMQLISGTVLRPMLDVPRAEILDYLKENDLHYRFDSTNNNTRFKRNDIRHNVVPKIDRQTVLKEATKAGKKLKKLFAEGKEWRETFIKNNWFLLIEFNKLNHDTKAEILIQLLGQKDLYQTQINRLIGFLTEAGTGKKLIVKHLSFVIEYNAVRFTDLQDDKPSLPKIKVDKDAKWGKWTIKNKTKRKLFVRQWQPGDKFQPSGMDGHKKVQDFFVDQKIPRLERKNVPIITNYKGEIVCVGHYRFDEHFKDFRGKLEVGKVSDQ